MRPSRRDASPLGGLFDSMVNDGVGRIDDRGVSPCAASASAGETELNRVRLRRNLSHQRHLLCAEVDGRAGDGRASNQPRLFGSLKLSAACAALAKHVALICSVNYRSDPGIGLLLQPAPPASMDV